MMMIINLIIAFLYQEDDELLAKGDLDSHASLAVRLRRAEKRILENVVSYSASQKASAADRWQQSSAEVRNDYNVNVACGSQSLHVSSHVTAAGHQQFVRVNDGPQVYGTDVERARRDAEFFESVRRGDYHSDHGQSNDQNQTECAVESEFMSLDIRTSVECDSTPPDCPASSAAELDDIGTDKSSEAVSMSVDYD